MIEWASGIRLISHHILRCYGDPTMRTYVQFSVGKDDNAKTQNTLHDKTNCTNKICMSYHS